MRKLYLALACSVALASCTSADLGKIDTAIQAGVPFVCKAAESFHAGFVLVSATGKLKPSLVAKEEAAHAELVLYCNDPAGASLASTLAAVTRAYIVIKDASLEAKRSE